MAKFKVARLDNGKYRITQKMRDYSGRVVGETVRYFNPITNDLENEREQK